MSNLGRVIKFTNITDTDFEFAFGGTPFLVRAKESRMFPYDLAEHGAKHLARKILINKDDALRVYNPADPTGGTGRNLCSPEEEQKLMAFIMEEEFNVEEEKPKSEADLLKERIAKLEALLLKDEKEEESTAIVVENVKGNAKDEKVYQDKAEVIAELTKRGIKFDARQNKEKLEELLK